LLHGYRHILIAGQQWMHHLVVYFKWYGRKPDGQIDHLDRDSTNNRPENLEDVTASENMHRSWATNPNRRTNAQLCGKPIVGTLGGVRREFASVRQAACELVVDSSDITACCGNPDTSTRGWTFVYLEQPDLDGEVWRAIKETRISNRGRAQTPTSGKYAPIPGVSGYAMIAIGGKLFRFHRVVCQAFYGEPPAGYHADHIDGNRSNNWAENLQWLSPAENIAKKRHSQEKSTRRAITTSTGGHYDSIAHACAALGLSRSQISILCSSGNAHAEHGFFKYAEAELIEGEIFKNVTEADLLALGRRAPLPSFDYPQVELI